MTHPMNRNRSSNGLAGVVGAPRSATSRGAAPGAAGFVATQGKSASVAALSPPGPVATLPSPATADSEAKSAIWSRVDEIIASYQAKPTALIMILQEVQQEYLHLPREAMERISVRMDLALSQIYGVATFYKAFSLEPRGRHHVCVCTGTACHVRNSRSILEKLERDLGVERGKTSRGGEFTLETVNCVGACALGPVVVADEKYYGHLTVNDVEPMIASIRRGPQPEPDDGEVRAGKGGEVS